jgi:hypothetical protein
MLQLSIKEIQDTILETQEDKTLHDMYIHKSPCAENQLGAVFFAISGTPPRGYAMYLPGEEGKAGTLHVFDNLGLKRKIMHCQIKDLDGFKDNDVWSAQAVTPLVEA